MGTPAYNIGLGQRRAQAILVALMASLNKRADGFAETICFRVGSRGDTEQIPGASAAANRRVEVFVRVSIDAVDVHATDVTSHKIPTSSAPPAWTTSVASSGPTTWSCRRTYRPRSPAIPAPG